MSSIPTLDPKSEESIAVESIIEDLTSHWKYLKTTDTTTDNSHSHDDSEEEDEKKENNNSTSKKQDHANPTQHHTHKSDYRTRVRVLTRPELAQLLSVLPRRLGIQPQARHNGRVCVGMAGYPNVGKSSVINTLLGVSKSSHGRLNLHF